jgi:hypothetical protein
MGCHDGIISTGENFSFVYQISLEILPSHIVAKLEEHGGGKA